MSTEREEFVLGQDVTEHASAKTRRESVVLSVRLSAEEAAQVEAICRATGKSMSQVVREALANFRLEREASPFAVTISFDPYYGGTVSTGRIDHSSRAEYTRTVEDRELQPA